MTSFLHAPFYKCYTFSEYLQKYDPRYARNTRRPRGIRRSDRAVELPDGRMVIPIDDEVEENEIGQKIFGSGDLVEKTSANEIAVANFDEEEGEDSFENEPESVSHTQGSVCSLSTKFGRKNLRSGLKNHDTLATVTSSTYAPGTGVCLFKRQQSISTF